MEYLRGKLKSEKKKTGKNFPQILEEIGVNFYIYHNLLYHQTVTIKNAIPLVNKFGIKVMKNPSEYRMYLELYKESKKV